MNRGKPRSGTNYVHCQPEYEHRLVIRAAGIEIPSGYIVHHKDGSKRNNNLDNLEVMSVGEHTKLHFGIDLSEPNACEHVPEECPICHKIHMVQYRYTKKKSYTGRCNSCNARLAGNYNRRC